MLPETLSLISDAERIEAARYAAEKLRELMEVCELLGGERPVRNWEHYVDSVGGVHSKRERS